MKKGPLLFLLLSLTVAAIFVVFLATFNADQFRPRIVRQLEAAIGSSVELKHISLTWRKGLALELSQLRVYRDAKNKTAPEMSFETGSVVLRLRPLLGRKIQIASIHLDKPKLSIQRTREGEVLIGGVGLDRGKYPKISKAKPGAKIAIPFLIDAIDIRGGQLQVSDEKGNAPFHVEVGNLDATFTNISLNRVGEVAAQMAMGGHKQNLSFKGKFRMPGYGELDLIQSGRIEWDLDSVNLKTLEESIPALKRFGFQDVLGGKLSFDVEQCLLDKNRVTDLKSRLVLNNGRIRLSQLAGPVEEISAEAITDKKQLEVKSFSAKLSGGQVKAAGTVEKIRSTPRVRFQVSVDNLALENFLPAISAKEPQLHGRVTGAFAGEWTGVNWAEISKTLAGEGQLAVKDGVIVNLSILRETLGKLSTFPQLLHELENSFPEKMRPKLTMTDTLLKSFDQKFSVKGGKIVLSEISAVTETLDLKGSAEVEFNGGVMGKADLRLAPDMSEEVAGIVPRMKSLLDKEGRIAIPLALEGNLPYPVIVPDLQYVTAHLPSSPGEKVQKKN